MACQPPNKQLQRTVIRHRGDAARAPFHYARASRCTRRRAAAGSSRVHFSRMRVASDSSGETPTGYAVRNGFHPFYASVAVGYKSVPAVVLPYGIPSA